jgi:hypothetical protein
MKVRYPTARAQRRRAGGRPAAVLVGLTRLIVARVRPTRLAATLPSPTRLVAALAGSVRLPVALAGPTRPAGTSATRLVAALIGLTLMLALLTPGGGSPARAQEAVPWEPTGLGDDVLALFTPASGAFFALTGERLLRSDDAGETWAPVPLPPSPANRGQAWAAVDPTNHDVMYAAGADGLYQSRDAGASWQRVLAAPTPSAQVVAPVVSPADPRLVYVFFLFSNQLSLHRSQDGGATWEQIGVLSTANSPCTSVVTLFQAHPTDPDRLYRTAGCYAGRDAGGGLDQSRDRGATWSATFRLSCTFPSRLEGGEGTTPARLYLGAGAANAGCPSVLMRSDDDGATWTERLRFPSRDRGVGLHALAYDPLAPDRVYVGLSGLEQGARTSANGGVTWSPFGLDGRDVHALALGIDGLNLYAATDQGVWRLRLAPAGDPQAE